MRITTWNVNGLRAALKKGFADCLEAVAPDVLLLQEVRSLPEQLPGEWANQPGWHVHWHPAQRKGYAGTAVWSRLPPEVLGGGLGPGEDDADGRVIRVRVQGVQVVSVYLPSGAASAERQAYKEAWLARFLPWARQLAESDEAVILGGDLNIAHTARDIFYAQGNAHNSGFLPHEREWFGCLLNCGWTDFVRVHFGDVDGPYSWWSNRGNARQLDRGWRIDYLLGNRAATARWRDATVYREGGLSVSDHAPVTINLREPT
ncbi:MAG: exodeoxyribonuclease III [Planctomycetota bacterium]|nr:exodeoxyribonuclease III [Planctomycetota bacterium]